MPHLLVTNDFPPKVGGIQTYLWELWRRLPADDVTVLTTAHPDAASFDAAQPFRIERVAERVLLPTPQLVRRIGRLADETGAKAVVLDPGLPLGLVGLRLDRPYVVVMHGSEALGRLPGTAQVLGRVLRGAAHVICAGNFPAAETRRLAASRAAEGPPMTLVPPGVDAVRFRPLAGEERVAARERFGVPPDALVVVGVSRLVPRKGFDVLVEAVADLAARFPPLQLLVGGAGRDRARLERLVERTQAPARLLGRVADEELPLLYGAADVFAMPCRGNRWAGVEVEGFGIVFLEAAACGVAQLAGASGGAPDAVVDGVTGVLVGDRPTRRSVARGLERLLADPQLRSDMGAAGRRRAAEEFSYDVLVDPLAGALASVT